jgi:hypothetical protein
VIVAPLLAWSVLAGCGSASRCTGEAGAVPGAELADGLTCVEAEDAVDYVELLAGRPVPPGDVRLVLNVLADKYEDDPNATKGWLDQLRAEGAELAQKTGLAGAELRATKVWSADRGEGLIKPEDGDLWTVQDRALSVWTKDDTEKIAMTESDLEAWIRYASLCREVQNGGVLRISVADRVTVYKVLIERFDTGDRPTQLALASLGPIWAQVRDRWQAASYEHQRAWMDEAPLPPPMTATSLAYAEAVFQGDLVRHAEVLQRVLGPFPVGSAERFAPPEQGR